MGDVIGCSAGALGVAINIPQIVTIFKSKDSTGISIVTQSLFLVNVVFWTVYGILKKDLVITVTSAPCVAVQIIAIVGTRLYRPKLTPQEPGFP